MIYFETTPEPHTVGQMFEASCLVNTVNGLTVDDMDITWHSSDGQLIISSGRITVGSIAAVNASWFSRTVTISELVGTDTGNYTCQARIRGEYVYSNEARATGELVVGGGKCDELCSSLSIMIIVVDFLIYFSSILFYICRLITSLSILQVNS